MHGESRETWTELEVEFERLGLSLRTCPIVGASNGAVPRLLAELRALQPPQRWRDILPGWPEHWDETNPDTWTIPHRSRGPHDQAEPPFGPLFIVLLPRETDDRALQFFVDEGRRAGHPIHGAAFDARSDAGENMRVAEIVLDRQTIASQFDEFFDWLIGHPAVTHANWDRGVNEARDRRVSYHLSYRA